MMKSTSLTVTLFLVAALALSGCFPVLVQVRSDPSADFSRYSTFGWIKAPDGYDPAQAVVPGFRKHVRESLSRILTSKGYQPAPDGTQPDLEVAFYTHVTHKHRVFWVTNWGYPYHPWHRYWGYGWGRWYDPWGGPPVEVDHYDVGTMVVDMIDARTNELIWRGWGRGVSSPGTPVDELLAAARKIMIRFPPRAAGTERAG